MIIGMTTVSSEEEANKISRTLVHEGLAACVNVLGKMKSFYKWRGKIEESIEYLLIIKTTENRKEKLLNRIKQLHSYELPEIIFLEVKDGYEEYLSWVSENVNQGS
jgi:periplasmic divalent cation tolerance protein